MKRNLWLDLYKIFLAFLVICIHFVGETYSHHVLYRIAVPTFFMISGYYLYNKDEVINLSKAKNFIKRCFKYLLIGFGVYIIYDFIMCYVDDKGVGYYFTTLFYEDFLFEFFFLNRPPTYHSYQIWFLIALFTISLVHYFMIKYKKEKYYKFIIPIGICIYLFFSGYMRLFQYTDMPIRYTRNAWFFGLPLFAIGYLMAQYDFHKKKVNKYIYLGIGIIFFFIQLLENKVVNMEMYLSTVIASAFLLQFFLGLKKVECNLFYNIFGKSLSFYIYILHVAVGVTLGRLIFISNLYLKSVYILLISIIICVLVFNFSKVSNIFYKKYRRCL